MPSRPPSSFEDYAVSRALGARIKELRAERGWTQEQLVERCGLDRSFLAEVEGGRANPTLRTLTRIAHGLQVDLRQLFEFTTVK